jgi:hypothetical protein
VRSNPKSRLEKNKMARALVMPATQANLLGCYNLLYHEGKGKAKDKGKGKGKGKDDTDDTEASVGCVCQRCSPSDASTQPAVHRMIRSRWPHVKAAAIKVHALLRHLCTQLQDIDQDMTQVGQDGGGGIDQWTADQHGKCAASIPLHSGRKAQWTAASLKLRLYASAALAGLPGIGEYGGAKILRIVIHWFLDIHQVTFPPGATWVWDKISKGQPKKKDRLSAAGLDVSSPLSFVESILRGGTRLPEDAKAALNELMRNVTDTDMGCLLCDFTSWFDAMLGGKKRNGGLRNTPSLLAFMNHLLISEDPVVKTMRQKGVSASLMGFSSLVNQMSASRRKYYSYRPLRRAPVPTTPSPPTARPCTRRRWWGGGVTG